LGRPFTGGELYGLWLLRGRIHRQRAAAVAEALQAARGAGALPPGWYDALCDFEAEAGAAAYRGNADRAEAAVLARHGLLGPGRSPRGRGAGGGPWPT
jgi:hypothetical protein